MSTVLTPTASISAGQISLLCLTFGATIYYTTDGSTPTSGSTAYSAPFAVSAGTNLKAIGIHAGYTNSQVLSLFYHAETVSIFDFELGPQAIPTVASSIIALFPS
jgi:hypothetical protein